MACGRDNLVRRVCIERSAMVYLSWSEYLNASWDRRLLLYSFVCPFAHIYPDFSEIR